MKFIWLIIDIIGCVYTFSADPRLFGSAKRRKGKAAIATEFKDMAADTQLEMDAIKTRNPFETAGAKSAITKASRGAKQMQQRMLNVLGGGASAEAMVASTGKTQEAIGSAAGEIAAGAEAQKTAEIARLRGEKMSQMGSYGGMQAASEDERGSGWKTLFEGINALGNVASGVGQGAGLFM